MLIKTEKKMAEMVFATGDPGSKTGFSTVDPDEIIFTDDGLYRAGAAKIAAALAFSASDPTMLRENLRALGYAGEALIGCDDCSETKIGTALAIREYRDAVQIAVILRPTVGREWYSNFDVGYGREHCGFLKAAEYAEQRLSDFLFVRSPKKQLRFFVIGYSRGGAAANLLAKRLCDRYGLDAVRAYTFASPNTCVSVKGARYGCIYNLIRDEDFFARVPLTGWGYTKYGRTLSLSGSGDFEKRYRRISGEKYIGFSSSKPVDTVLAALLRLSPHLHAYYERRREIGGYRLSLHDYLCTVAEALADEADETTVDVLFSAAASDYAELSDFLSAGMDIASLFTPASGLPRCSVSDSHSPAAYSAALEGYLK